MIKSGSKYNKISTIFISILMTNAKSFAFVGCIVAAAECADFIDSIKNPKPKEPILSEPIISEPIKKGARCVIAALSCP